MNKFADGSIGYSSSGHVATISLDRPAKANAVTPDMALSLFRAFERADADDRIRAIILTGAGKTFSAGSDITTLARYESPWHFRARRDYCDAVLSCRKPVIAAVNGAAFGGGLEMAISCDVRIAAESARFAAPEVGLGWLGGGGASQLLPRLIGSGAASWLLMSGEAMSAESALACGLVQRLVPDAELQQVAVDMAESISLNAPIAVQAAKAAIRASHSMSLTDGMQYEEELLAVCMWTNDRHEGVSAFSERRRPNFGGR